MLCDAQFQKLNNHHIIVLTFEVRNGEKGKKMKEEKTKKQKQKQKKKKKLHLVDAPRLSGIWPKVWNVACANILCTQNLRTRWKKTCFDVFSFFRCPQCTDGMSQTWTTHRRLCQKCSMKLNWQSTRAKQIIWWDPPTGRHRSLTSETKYCNSLNKMHKTERSNRPNKFNLQYKQLNFLSQVNAYGGYLEYAFRYHVNISMPRENLRKSYLANFDIILEVLFCDARCWKLYGFSVVLCNSNGLFSTFVSLQGSGIRLGHRGEYYHNDTENLVRLQMVESSWRHADGSTSPQDTLVPREEMLIVLADVSRLLVRATYHLYQTHAT